MARDVTAERQIERRLLSRFDVDTSRLDVTVKDREATFSGILRKRSRHAEFTRLEFVAIRKHFSPERIAGVDRYYYKIANIPPEWL